MPLFNGGRIMIHTYTKKYTLYKYLLDKKGLNWCAKIDLCGFVEQNFFKVVSFWTLNADNEFCLLETAFTL